MALKDKMCIIRHWFLAWFKEWINILTPRKFSADSHSFNSIINNSQSADIRRQKSLDLDLYLYTYNILMFKKALFFVGATYFISTRKTVCSPEPPMSMIIRG